MTVDSTFGRPMAERDAADRWVYVATAGLCTATAIVGFFPNSAAILAGDKPNPPLEIHIHAALMVCWLALLMAQTMLVALRRTALHRKLGVASLVLGPAVVVGMIAATLQSYEPRVAAALARGLPPEMADIAGANVVLAQVRAIIYFTIFFAIAILVRQRDPETHKRMMLLATIVPLPAAIVRITWLPNALPANYDLVHGYMLLLLAPAVIYDIVRLGRPHNAYVIGFALLLPWMIATHFLWASPGWAAAVKAVIGG